MSGEFGAISGYSNNNISWFKVKETNDKPKEAQQAGAYMACNDIGNYLNGNKAYS
ncbi:hypothetical protein J6R97_07735 [bacterium]|nr:hypothetical protein [bacterium]